MLQKYDCVIYNCDRGTISFPEHSIKVRLFRLKYRLKTNKWTIALRDTLLLFLISEVAFLLTRSASSHIESPLIGLQYHSWRGQSAAVYSLKENKFLMEYHSTYLMNVLAASEDPYLNGDYVIFASYGVDEEARKSPTGESWIPWNDNEGGAGLYDLTNGRWVFENVSGLEYIGHGLIWVRGQGLYDISMGRWALQTEKDLRNWEDLNDLYVEEKGEYGNTYFFDKEAGSFIMMLADFKPSDYMAIKEMNGQPRYIPVRHYNKWEIFDAKDQKRIQYECDRISLMYLEKKITAQ